MSDVVALLLKALETELKQLQLWSALPPSPQAMASNTPFCYDTMSLQQWLQYVFIPRMQALLDAKYALPNKISMLPIAENVFNPADKQFATLLAIIAKLDLTLSATL